QLIKSVSDPLPYQIDLILLHEKTVGLEKTEKEWAKFNQNTAKDLNQTLRAATLLVYKDQLERAKDILLTARKQSKQNTLFAAELGEVYMKTMDYQKGIDEFLLAMENEP